MTPNKNGRITVNIFDLIIDTILLMTLLLIIFSYVPQLSDTLQLVVPTGLTIMAWITGFLVDRRRIKIQPMQGIYSKMISWGFHRKYRLLKLALIPAIIVANLVLGALGTALDSVSGASPTPFPSASITPAALTASPSRSATSIAQLPTPAVGDQNPAAFKIYIYPTQNSFTLYIEKQAGIPLDKLKFNDVLLSDTAYFPVLRIQQDYTGHCFRLYQGTLPPLEAKCQPESVKPHILQISPSDVFWVNVNTQIRIDVEIKYNDDYLTTCERTQFMCEVSYSLPPTETPVPETRTETPVETPVSEPQTETPLPNIPALGATGIWIPIGNDSRGLPISILSYPITSKDFKDFVQAFAGQYPVTPSPVPASIREDITAYDAETWQEANAYCQNFQNQYYSYRLPTKRELEAATSLENYFWTVDLKEWVSLSDSEELTLRDGEHPLGTYQKAGNVSIVATPNLIYIQDIVFRCVAVPS